MLTSDVTGKSEGQSWIHTQSRGHVTLHVLFLQLHLEVLVELDPQLH